MVQDDVYVNIYTDREIIRQRKAPLTRQRIEGNQEFRGSLVELSGIEPLAFSLRTRRSPN